MLARMVRDLNADGIFLDTMEKGAAGFRAKLDSIKPGIVLEGEGVPPLERMADHHASWAQHFQDSPAPGVLRHKWIERRHMQHQIWRWKFDHSAEIHTAWMNGSGVMVWENVFGAWVGWNARDRSLLRSMLPIQRRFVDLFCGDGWEPWCRHCGQAFTYRCGRMALRGFGRLSTATRRDAVGHCLTSLLRPLIRCLI
jgi:hypothetical protein